MAAELGRQYLLMLEWEWLRRRPTLALTLIVQTLVGAGTIVGFGLLLPGVSPVQAEYLATGGPTLALISVGLLLVPPLLGEARVRGAFDYVASLPVSRLAFPAAAFTSFFAIALPGMLTALVIGSVRFHFALHPVALLLPAVLLVGITATAIGYMVGVVCTSLTVISLVGNALAFFILLFSPINFPPDHLPGWMAAIHQVLPIQHMATLVRSTLTGHAGPASSWLVVSLWCAGALLVASLVPLRRD